MPKPTEDIRWASEDVVDPVSELPNTEEPTTLKKDAGWAFLEAPPRQWMNYWMRGVARWIGWLEGEADASAAHQGSTGNPHGVTAAQAGAEPAFAKGSLVQGEGAVLTGTLANRLVGAGNVTVDTVLKMETVTLDLDGSGDFTGGSVLLVKIGRLVIMTNSAGTAPTHASTADALTAIGFIPVAFRPVANSVSNVTSVDFGGVVRINVTVNGTLTLSYREWDGSTDDHTIAPTSFMHSWLTA